VGEKGGARDFSERGPFGLLLNPPVGRGGGVRWVTGFATGGGAHYHKASGRGEARGAAQKFVRGGLPFFPSGKPKTNWVFMGPGPPQKRRGAKAGGFGKGELSGATERGFPREFLHGQKREGGEGGKKNPSPNPQIPPQNGLCGGGFHNKGGAGGGLCFGWAGHVEKRNFCAGKRKTKAKGMFGCQTPTTPTPPPPPNNHNTPTTTPPP